MKDQLELNRSEVKGFSLEIEIHEAKLDFSICNVDYTVSDNDGTSDVSMGISKSKLLKHIQENELNIYCSDLILGEFSEMDAETYLADNLNDVVHAYLMEGLK